MESPKMDKQERERSCSPDENRNNIISDISDCSESEEKEQSFRKNKTTSSEIVADQIQEDIENSEKHLNKKVKGHNLDKKSNYGEGHPEEGYVPPRPTFLITDILSRVTTTRPVVHPYLVRSPEEPQDLSTMRSVPNLARVFIDTDNSEDDHETSKIKVNIGDRGSPIMMYKSKKPRKARTAFSENQLRCLEKHFDRQKYLSVQDRIELATKLQLSDAQVKTWYQNRRTKWKRQTSVGLELLTEAGNYAAVQRILQSNSYWSSCYPQTASLVSNFDSIVRGTTPLISPRPHFPNVFMPGVTPTVAPFPPTSPQRKG